jgi:hypothetical protein
MPISGPYESARVLIILGETSRIELEQIIDPSDIIIQGSGSRDAIPEWLIDCGDPGVDVVALMCGWPILDGAEIANLVFSMAQATVANLNTGHVGYDLTTLQSSGFRKYTSGDGYLIGKRLRDILRVMGFPSHMSGVTN